MTCFRLIPLAIVSVLTGAIFTSASAVRAADRPPNFVIVYADDQGYGDLGCFGAKDFKTPHIDRLAQQGRKFTSFYVAQAVCSASRTALLTGCYPNRVGILGALNPKTTHGISDREMTIAQVLKQRGYATAIYGKWHLGHHQRFLPIHHGFDEYFGLPYSNDMSPLRFDGDKGQPPLPLIEGDATIERNPDLTRLTTRYTERAVRFIENHKDRPFFLYVPHTMPHVPLGVSDKFKGKSRQGMYGDVIQEIDWSVGEIVSALDKHKLADNTLVIYATDNGPWLSYGNHAGGAGPLREGKGTTWEGGVRVPCVMRWPGKIPAGTACNELAATIDILPTLAKLADAPLPKNKIDGLDIWPLIAGAPDAKTPHEAYYYYWNTGLEAIRSGKWKLHFPHEYRALTGTPGKDGRPAGYTPAKTDLALYDLESDVGERTNVADKHPDVVERLQKLAESARQDLGDSATKRKGVGTRSPGSL